MRPESADGDDPGRARGHLRLSLRHSQQLFNSFDPSPFYEKDLDGHAEQFPVSWASELHPHADLRLTLYLKEAPAEPQPEQWLMQAIHHHFGERLDEARAELRALLRQGRASLAIGTGFLALCLFAARLLATGTTGGRWWRSGACSGAWAGCQWSCGSRPERGL